MTEEQRSRHPLEGRLTSEEDDQTEQAKRKVAIRVVTNAQKPVLTYVLIALNIAIFVVRYFSPEIQRELMIEGALIPVLVYFDGDLYRLFTAMFLHANAAHIALNMLTLYSLGPQVEMLYGRTRFLAIYFLGGLLGSVLSAAIGDYGVPSVGASGAILAVWGAMMLYLYLNRVLLGQGRIRQALQGQLLYLGFFLILGFLPNSNIDNWGHIGGFIGGALVAFLLPIQMQVVQLQQGDGTIMAQVADKNARIAPSLLYARLFFVLAVCVIVFGIGYGLFLRTL